MKKNLFLICVSVVAIHLSAQNNQKDLKANSLIKEELKSFTEEKEIWNYAPLKNTANNQYAKKINPNTNGIAAVTAKRFSGSHNVFGILISEQRPLQYNSTLNAISFIHRASTTYTQGITFGNSGTMAAWISTNNGITWDSTCIWANASNLGRTPQGGIYNFPSTNTVLANAYIVGMGSLQSGSGWIGNWYAGKQLNSFNKTPGLDQQSKLNGAATTSCNVHSFSREGFSATDDGLIRCTALMLNNANAANTGIRGAGIVKGVFNAGAFLWSLDSLIPFTGLRSNGNKLLDQDAVMAFNDAGTVGYVVMYGVTSSTTNASQCGYQPIVFKTTNSGATWNLLPAITWTTNTFQRLVDRLWSTTSNANVVVPRFTNQEGHGVTVDINNNLHLVTTVRAHAIKHPDSLDYYTPWTANKYQWPETSYGWPYIYDFYTTASGGWQGILVDSMGTEGPSGGTSFSSPGYTANPWVDASAANNKIKLDARIQVARSADGKKIFYSWAETDTNATAHHWNIFPDIKTRAWDVVLDKMTPRYNVTTGTGNKTDQLSYFHYMANKAIPNNPCGGYEIPFTASNNLAKDGSVPIDHYYFDGFIIPCSDYTLASFPLSGIDLGSQNTSITSKYFDVTIYPNPVNGEVATLLVNLEEASEFDVSVYSIVGQLLENIKINGQKGGNEIDIDVSKMNSGVYLYRVKVGHRFITKKLILE